MDKEYLGYLTELVQQHDQGWKDRLELAICAETEALETIAEFDHALAYERMRLEECQAEIIRLGDRLEAIRKIVTGPHDDASVMVEEIGRIVAK
jgi:hypothetical protein